MGDSAPCTTAEEAKSLLSKRWDIHHLVQETHPVEWLLELTLQDVDAAEAAVKAAEDASANTRRG